MNEPNELSSDIRPRQAPIIRLGRLALTDAGVIAAIRANHLKANISDPTYVRHYWDEAWLDPGGTIFGDGPYVKLPVDWVVSSKGRQFIERVVIRVYAPARLARKLARLWQPVNGATNRRMSNYPKDL